MNPSDWKRVAKRRPCPVCGRSDWCLYCGPDDTPMAVICARVESAKRCGAAGWLHRLRDERRGSLLPRRHTVIVVPSESASGGLDFGKLAADCCGAVKLDDLRRLALSLGLSVESLQRFSIGWSSRHRGWTFPMQDASGHIVGVRLRLANGRKLAVKGGHEGLFVPTGLDASDLLLVCEGPMDAAALLEIGFPTVGRPSCVGGVRLLVELVRQRRPAHVVLVADADAPGRRGAEALAMSLVAYAPAVRIIVPPAGIKDAREWKQKGATTAEVQSRIEAASPRKLIVRVKAGRGRR